MSRTELIEIIYALQQEEQKLQQENDDLKSQLEDKRIRMEKAGSIAEASLSLNRIFEDAQSAADQYLLSLQKEQEELKDSKAAGEEEIKTARKKARRILASARKQAEEILAEAKQEDNG